MKCKKCGAELSVNDKFCLSCGELVDNYDVNTSVPEQPAESVAPVYDTPASEPTPSFSVPEQPAESVAPVYDTPASEPTPSFSVPEQPAESVAPVYDTPVSEPAPNFSASEQPAESVVSINEEPTLNFSATEQNTESKVEEPASVGFTNSIDLNMNNAFSVNNAINNNAPELMNEVKDDDIIPAAEEIKPKKKKHTLLIFLIIIVLILGAIVVYLYFIKEDKPTPDDNSSSDVTSSNVNDNASSTNGNTNEQVAELENLLLSIPVGYTYTKTDSTINLVNDETKAEIAIKLIDGNFNTYLTDTKELTSSITAQGVIVPNGNLVQRYNGKQFIVYETIFNSKKVLRAYADNGLDKLIEIVITGVDNRYSYTDLSNVAKMF